MLNSCATNVLSQLRSVIVGVAFTELRSWLRVGGWVTLDSSTEIA